MIVLGAVFATLAAVIHVVIFYLESVGWTGSRARAVFGTTQEEAEATRELAFNQGFYNLFLAIEVIVGALVLVAGSTGVGSALVLAGVGSMTAAAALLAVTSPDKRGAAAKQGGFPALAVVFLVAGLAL